MRPEPPWYKRLIFLGWMAQRRRKRNLKPDSPGNPSGLHRALGLQEVTAGGVGFIIGETGELVWCDALGEAGGNDLPRAAC